MIGKNIISWKGVLLTAAIIIVTAVVVGGSVWYFMDSRIKEEIRPLNKAVR